jgi:L-rhamnono-1,4-lactonase
MKAGDHLTRQYSINEYDTAIAPEHTQNSVIGFVYVETDRFIPKDQERDVAIWAAEPLKEIAFLRRIVEGCPDGPEGFNADNAAILKGIVAWAPLDRPLDEFLRYMASAKEVAGDKTWSMITGFRFLVQGIRDEEDFQRLVDPSDSSFVALLKFLGSRHLSFDIGVDQRQGGVWQLERFAKTIELAHQGVHSREKTVFILSKPKRFGRLFVERRLMLSRSSLQTKHGAGPFPF